MYIHNQAIKDKLISIVIPVYNTEKLLPRCLDSIGKQTYSNTEIIIVNDCSSGDTFKIVQDYINKNMNIKYVEHDINKGLFQARLTGAKEAKGDFIAFLDSDDYVAVDFYRMLIYTALENDADIVCSEMVVERELDGYRYIFPLNKPNGEILEKDEILKDYFRIGRFAYYKPVVWNKIYKIDLWTKAYEYLKNIEEEFTSFEDVLYSTVLHSYAEKYVTVEYKGSYYYQNYGASTSLNDDVNKYMKNIKDIGISFSLVRSFLTDVGKMDMVGDQLRLWMDRELIIWCNNVKNTRFTKQSKNMIYSLIEESFDKECIFEKSILPYNLSYLTRMDNDESLENIRLRIIDECVECVSFDFNEVLISRSLLNREDIFEYLDYYEYGLKLKLTFSTIRKEAGEYCNKNIDEIYDYISDKYNVEDSILCKYKKAEILLHKNLTKARDSIRNIYYMALDIGKKIVIYADTVLGESDVEDILFENGYIGYDFLYIRGKDKIDFNYNNFMKVCSKAINISGENFFHIRSDHNENGKDSPNIWWYRSSGNSIITNGSIALQYYENEKSALNYSSSLNSPLIKSILAMIANKYFDNPYKDFAKGSDFNGDPFFIGYYALGMYVFGIVKWLIEKSIDDGIKVLNFHLDGIEVFKNAYDIISSFYPNAPQSYSMGGYEKGHIMGNEAVFSMVDLCLESSNYTVYPSSDNILSKVKSYYRNEPEISLDIRKRFTTNKKNDNSFDDFVSFEFQRGINDFIVDIVEQLGPFIKKSEVIQADITMPFEMLMKNPTAYDRKVFSCTYVNNKDFRKVWKQSIKDWGIQNNKPKNLILNYYEEVEFLQGKNIYLKAVFYLLHNRKVLKEKVKSKLYNRFGIGGGIK